MGLRVAIEFLLKSLNKVCHVFAINHTVMHMY